MCPKDNVSDLVKASADKKGEAVDPTYFRNVLMAHTGRFKKDASECLAYILNSIIIRLFLFYDQKTRRNAGHTIFGLDHIIKRYIVLPMNMMLKRGIRILLTSLSLHSRPNTEC